MDLDLVRLAAALVHGVRGLLATVELGDGTTRVVSTHPGAHDTPCAWRQRVIAGGHDFARRVHGIELRGAEPVGAGVYRGEGAAGQECWFATTLCPADIRRALAACRVPISGDVVTVSIRPDPGLGASVCRIRITDASVAHHLIEVALSATAACAVEELLRHVRDAGCEGTAAHSPPDRS